MVIGERKAGLDLAGSDGVALSPASGKVTGVEMGKDLSHSLRGETVLERSRDAVHVKRSLPPNSTAAAAAVPRRKKSEKPRWQTVVSVLTKNFILLLVLLLLVQMVRRLALNQGSVVIPASDYEGRIAEMESFLKTTTKMLQVQMEVVDRKIESEIAGVRKEVGDKIEDNGAEFGRQLKKLDVRVEILEKSAKEWVGKDDFDKFVEEFKKAKGGDQESVNLDEVRAFAREIVQKEIEKHAADGLGMVDYAVETGGAIVVKHSEPYFPGRVSSWFNRHVVHSDAMRVLRPSFGEPGQCFPLKGNSGFVQIRLRTAIIPKAVTLEHVAKSVAFDRSSAPKDCRVSGWFRGQETTDLAVDTEKMLLLTEFTYDLEKSFAQTFNLLDSAGSGIVDTIRLDVTSNHGSPTHTCIYRLRVHGHEPNSVSTLAVQS